MAFSKKKCYLVFKLKGFLKNRAHLILIPLHLIYMKCEFKHTILGILEKKPLITLVHEYMLRSVLLADLNSLTKFQLI